MSGGSLPIKKVYIDSRFKTKDSVSNSHFKYELVESLQLPDNTVCYVDDVIIPHSYFNISDNDTLYVRQFDGNLNSSKIRTLRLIFNYLYIRCCHIKSSGCCTILASHSLMINN